MGSRLTLARAAGLVMAAALSVQSQRAALADPAYHRYVMFGQLDARLTQQLGRALEPHERQGELRGPQLEIVRRAERAIADRSSEILAIRTARQTAKNECEAFLECRALRAWRGIPGSVWVRTAPTHKPQIVNSKLRLEKHLQRDPLAAGWIKREGYIYALGEARIEFLSGSAASNVVGATASIALSVDEAHHIDRGKFEEELAPFTASTNAPTILWGVAADKQDLLHEYRERLLESGRADCVMDYPAAVWAELIPAYAAHYEGRRALLGADHPVILTQYDLVDVESIGTYLNPAQRAALFSGDHPRLEAPRAGMQYAVVVDIGGETEGEIGDEATRETEPGRDSTMVWMLEWDPAGPTEPFPFVRVVQGYWWTGKQHEAAGPEIVKLCEHWNVTAGCIDAVGVGEATAGYVTRRHPSVRPYKANVETISEDCYDLLARLNQGRVLFWRADPAQDAERREMEAQVRHTRYQIRGHTKMRLAKPVGSGSTDLHIDGVKALTYLRMAVGAKRIQGLVA